MLCRMTYLKPGTRHPTGHTFWASDLDAARAYAHSWEDTHEDHVLLTLKRVSAHSKFPKRKLRSPKASEGQGGVHV